MTGNETALFFLRGNNEADQIVPIIYKLGQRNNINITVLENYQTSTEDYRITAIRKFDNVSVHSLDKTSSTNLTIFTKVVEGIKKMAKAVPSNLPERLYKSTIVKNNQIIPGELIKNSDAVLFDWGFGYSQNSNFLIEQEDIETMCLPFGSAPFVNPLEEQPHFDKFLENMGGISTIDNIFNMAYDSYDRLLKHNYLFFPDYYTARRVNLSPEDERMFVLGSPRYSQEWLDILSDIRPNYSHLDDSNVNIVMFLRRESFFVNITEVVNTIKLLNEFNGIQVVVKEHPRDRLLEKSVASDLKNIKIIKDEIPSVSLVSWGDVFLSLGTSITFEPIMREKPVLTMEYAHGNHTIISKYLCESDMRCKEDVFQNISRFLSRGTQNFYYEDEHELFVDEIITCGNNRVLSTWAKSIENIID